MENESGDKLYNQEENWSQGENCMSEETIWIITREYTPSDEDAKGKNTYSNPWGDDKQNITEVATGLVKVSVEKLETELSHFLQLIGKVLSHAQKQINQQTGFKLDEVELCVEITGEGEVKLLGTGVKTGTKGGLTLKFKQEANNTQNPN